MSARRWLREPLLHFFVIGAALFALYGVLNRETAGPADVIVVDDDRADLLAMQFERTWMRSPSPDELRTMIDKWVREEVLYREGVAMGLDQNDPVFRRRVAQKMSFIAEGGVDESVSEEALQAWLDDHPEQYQLEPTFTFRQVFFKAGAGQAGADRAGVAETVEQAKAALRSGADIATVGVSSMLPQTMDAATESRVNAMFGDGFAGAIRVLPVGEWAGPVDSPFGAHLVFVENVTPARDVTLDEVRKAVLRDVLAARRESADLALYESLRQKYTVVLPEGLADTGAAPASSNPPGAP